MMIASMFFDDVKNYLDITWEDSATNEKVRTIVSRAISILQSYAGCELDLAQEGEEKQLLLDCCRYIYNNAFEDFKTNFKEDLFMLRAKYQIKEMEQKDDQ